MPREPLAILPPPGPLSPRRLAAVARLVRGVTRTSLAGRMPALHLLPLLPLMSRYAASGDAWTHVRCRVPPWVFGPGAPPDFRWCFESETNVRVRSVNELCEWLRGCRYAYDRDVFVTSDYWQHPRTFELIRRGDCEDHAMWAWRKLREIGFPAWLVVGRVNWPHAAGHTHVWVQFTRGEGEEVVLEAAAKDGSPMIRTVDEVRDEYRPHFAVEHGTFWTRVYGGFLENLEMYQNGRRAKTADPAGRV